jgi:hypothetical protein
MPPHDIWNSNPVFTLSFFSAYEDVLRTIGFRETSDETEDVAPGPDLDMDSDEETEYDSDSMELMCYESDTSVEELLDYEYDDWGDDLGELPSLSDFARDD